jgi:hypothetical protein
VKVVACEQRAITAHCKIREASGFLNTSPVVSLLYLPIRLHKYVDDSSANTTEAFIGINVSLLIFLVHCHPTESCSEHRHILKPIV